MKILTRINERSWCEQFIRLRRFISSKATIINIFWHQNGITRRKYIYIYKEISLEIFFPMIHVFDPFSFAFFLVHLSLSVVVFSLVFRVAICIYIATVIRPLFSKIPCMHYFAMSQSFDDSRMEYQTNSEQIEFSSRIHKRDFPPRSQNLTIFILIARKFLSKNFKLLSVDLRLTIITRIYFFIDFSFVLKHSGNKFLPRIFQTSPLRAPK